MRHTILSRTITLLIVSFAVGLLPVLGAAQSIHAQDDQEQQHKDIARALIEDAYNLGNVAIMDAIYAPTFIRQPGGLRLREVKVSILALRAAMPDLKATINLLLAEADWVALRIKLRGTLKNELVFPNSVPIPPNNKLIDLIANIALRFDGAGRVVEEWNGFDNLGFLAQIGAIPPPQIPPQPPPETFEIVPSPLEQQNKESLVRYFAGLSIGNFAMVGELFRPDLSAYNSFGRFDRDQFLADLTALRNALPNLSIVITQFIAEGNWTAALYRIRGTFSNEYRSLDGSITLPPTGKGVELLIITFFRFDEQGMIQESFELYDSWDFLTQLGLSIPGGRQQ